LEYGIRNINLGMNQIQLKNFYLNIYKVDKLIISLIKEKDKKSLIAKFKKKYKLEDEEEIDLKNYYIRLSMQ
jgi:hypothetical protein